jgi:predicted lipid-binding transport protein (Tim44 family)
MEDTLVGIMKSEMVEAYMDGNTAHITIKFISEQVNAVRDESGDVVEGDASVVLTVNDFWTFARDTKKNDPNWLLVATRSLE